MRTQSKRMLKMTYEIVTVNLIDFNKLSSTIKPSVFLQKAATLKHQKGDD